ncbi:MAG: porin family protein, partial [Bacteroidales bacterium]|nr:porin family protein [Bacteroidales bacterium]
LIMLKIQIISKLLLTVLLILLSKNIMSQKYSLAPSIGIKGGISISSIKGDDIFDENYKKKSANFEIFSNYYFSKYLSLQSGITYDRKGAKFESYELETNLHYLSIPIYMKIQFFEDPEFYIYGGGYGSYLIMANTKGIYSDLDNTFDVDENIKSNISNIDYGISIGGGVQNRYNSNIDLFLDIRISLGLKPINKNNTDLRYNISRVMRYEYEINNPINKSIYITTGIIYYFVPR